MYDLKSIMSEALSPTRLPLKPRPEPTRTVWCDEGDAEDFVDTMFDAKEFKALMVEYAHNPGISREDLGRAVESWIRNLEERKTRNADWERVNGGGE